MATKPIRCPACGETDDLRRSRTRLEDWLFRIIGMKPWRCLNCDRRFHGW